MSKISAKQIVASMLEDFAGEDPDRAGGPEDIWRKGGFKKFDFKGNKFTGKRHGDTTKPVSDKEDEEEDASAPPKTNKPKSRFTIESSRRK